MQQNIKKIFGIAMGILLLIVVGVVMPLPTGMTPEAQRVLGIALFAICVWISDAFPIGIGSVFAMALIPTMGVLTFDTTLQQFGRPATFFVIATYGITSSLAYTPLSKRLLRSMIRIAGTETNRIILALMACTAVISTIVSNVPVTAMMMTVAFTILNGMEAKPGQSGIGRALMIGIPFAAMCGGIATPAGSSVNVISIDLLQTTTGTTVTFLKWMLYGVPLTVILLPVSWLIVVRLFKPEPIPAEIVDKLLHPADVPEEITGREKKALCVIVLTVLTWVAGSWIRALDMTLVATFSMLIFFLPGMNIFTWKEFSESISWDAVFTVGSVVALGNAVVRTGLSAWLVDVIFKNSSTWTPILLFLAVAFTVNFIHLILPTAPSIATLLLPPMLALAMANGYSTEAFTVIIATMSGCVMLLPVDTLTVLTYSTKYYTIPELFKAGILNSCLWSALIALWSYLVSSVF
jgi:sodium-dependent dicarboxylate transporter 2/3/5